MPQVERRTMHVSVPDADLHRFALERARRFFGDNASKYIGELIRLDREHGIVPDEITRRLTDATVEETEAVPA